MKKYKIIYADPPWKLSGNVYQDNKRKNRKLSDNYSLLSLTELKNLPIQSICDDDCMLFLWIVGSMLPEALELIKDWGFSYSTIGFVWVKKTKNNKTCANVGYWTMGNCAVCLIAKKGKMIQYKQKCNIYQLVEAERKQHSKKPDEVRNRIVELMGDIPRIELFAREKTEGWDVWGNEVESDIEL